MRACTLPIDAQNCVLVLGQLHSVLLEIVVQLYYSRFPIHSMMVLRLNFFHALKLFGIYIVDSRIVIVFFGFLCAG